MLTQSPAQAPFIEARSPTQTLAQSAAKDDSRTPSLHLFDPAEHAKKLSPHILTQSPAPAPLVHTPSPTLAQSAVKNDSQTPSPDTKAVFSPLSAPVSHSLANEAPAVPLRQLKFSAQLSPSPPPPPAEKKSREPKLYLEDYTEQEMQNLVQAVTPLRGKKGGVSIEKVKEMLRKGITLSELTNLVLNKKKTSRFGSFYLYRRRKRSCSKGSYAC